MKVQSKISFKEKICPNCQKPFIPVSSNSQKYCSSQCSGYFYKYRHEWKIEEDKEESPTTTPT